MTSSPSIFGQAGLALGASKSSKRRRAEYQSEDPDGAEASREFKYAKPLPIRASSVRPARPTVVLPDQQLTSYNSQNLTPAESSEDELFDDAELRLGNSRVLDRDYSQASSDRGESSTRTQADEDNDEAMDIADSQKSAPAPLRLAAQMTQAPLFTSQPYPAARNGSDRLPTPIRPTFRNNADTDMSGTSGPLNLAMLRTTLSPLLGTDATPLTPQMGGLPSPDSGCSEDEMELSSREHWDHAPHGSTFAQPTRQNAQLPRPASNIPGLNGQSERPAVRRTPRLYMGFREDCEKCIQRVPGHYSHILWS